MTGAETMNATPADPDVITAEEISIVREATLHLLAFFRERGGFGGSKDIMQALALRWRAAVPEQNGNGFRLVATYVQVYLALEAEGDIDGSWDSWQTVMALAEIVDAFPNEYERYHAVFDAINVAQWSGKRDYERKYAKQLMEKYPDLAAKQHAETT